MSHEPYTYAFGMSAQMCQIVINVVGCSLNSRQMVTLVCASLAMVGGLSKTDIKVRHFLRKGPRLAIDLEIYGANSPIAVAKIGEHISLESSPLHSLRELKNLFSGAIFHVLAPKESENDLNVPGEVTTGNPTEGDDSTCPDIVGVCRNFPKRPLYAEERNIQSSYEGDADAADKNVCTSGEPLTNSVFKTGPVTIITDAKPPNPVHNIDVSTTTSCLLSEHFTVQTIPIHALNTIPEIGIVAELVNSSYSANKLEKNLEVSSFYSASILAVEKANQANMTDYSIDDEIPLLIPSYLVDGSSASVDSGTSNDPGHGNLKPKEIESPQNIPRALETNPEFLSRAGALASNVDESGPDLRSDEQPAQSFVIRKKALNLWDDD